MSAASELRRDPTSGRWVIIAPGRARRPRAFLSPESAASRESSETGSCPFCPGNESQTPPETAAYRGAGTAPDSPGWRVRVVPNKFPALVGGEKEATWPRRRGLFESMEGIGAHEVIIDTPVHHHDLSDLPTAALAEVLRMIGDRIRAIEAEGRTAYVQVFKNKGQGAGASIVHPHTQIVATPLIPGQVLDEIQAAEKAFERDRRCLFCRLIEEETAAGERLVRRSDRFAAIAPFASRFPYEVHILPLRHAPDFSSLDGGEGIDLADMLKTILGRMKEAFSDPPYNLILHQGARPEVAAAGGILLPGSFHWHWELFPVLTRAAGFEWGTGLFINPVPPEDAARFLRGGPGPTEIEI